MRFAVRQAWTRLMRMTGRDLWERDLGDFGPARRALVTVLRIAAVVIRGFSRQQLTTRAGSLTYVTLFSLVPTLAVALAMFSAFGGMASARDTLMARLVDYLAVGVRDEVSGWLDRMLANIGGGALGATGLVFVIIAVFTLLSSIEDVFNDIWGVKRTRGYLERLTLYWTAITVSPTLIVLGMSLPTLFERLLPVHWVLAHTGMREVVFGMLAPWLFVVGGFAALYLLLTARRIPVASVAIGALVGGTLWLAAAAGYGWYARSTVYYANIYGSLAAIPIFIFWLYLSWLLVFIGAQVSFAWQNLDTYREEILSTAPSQRSREQLALRILGGVARRWVRGMPPATAAEIAAAQRTSARAVNEVVTHLVELRLLAELGSDGQLMLLVDPHRLRPCEVLEAMRGAGEDVAVDDSDLVMQRLGELYADAAEAVRGAWDDVTFADLLTADEAPAARVARSKAR